MIFHFHRLVFRVVAIVAFLSFPAAVIALQENFFGMVTILLFSLPYYFVGWKTFFSL